MSCKIKHTPLVSILMPVRNGGIFLQPAITSALEQTYQNIEVIISNNHSTDSSEAIISSFDSNKITRIVPPRPYTMTENWNYALAHARGKYAILLGSDDILHNDYIEERVKYHESNPDVFLSSSPNNIIDENSITTSICDSNLRGLHTRENLIPILLSGNPLNIITVFFKIEQLNSVEATIFPDHRYFPDWALWLEMVLLHKYVYFFDSIRCDYRIHSSSATNSVSRAKWTLEATKLITNFLCMHSDQLAALGYHSDSYLKKHTSALWLTTQRALRDGEWNVARQLWGHYRRYHGVWEVFPSLIKELKQKSMIQSKK